ncbi:tyrosine-type recombinase/integrase [Roseibacillus persicicus]|nr:tyrosine-type recombinase/integrase [Roseibacillus persicicus]
MGEFDHEELVALINAAEGEWKAGIILAAHTGLRRENIIRLKWTEVALSERKLHVRLVKQRYGKKPKVGSIPLTAAAFNAVSSQVGNNETYVFDELSKLKGSDPNNRFNKIMAKAKVPKRKTLQGGIEVKRSFHSLRHTFTSLLANRDIAPEIRQELTGHTSSEIHQIYTDLGDEVLRDAIGKLPSLSNS